MPKEFNAAVYDKKKLALLRKRAKRVEQLYILAVRNASRIATQTSYKGEGDFFFDNYPSAKTEIDNMLQELAQALETNITEGNNENWKLAASKNDAMVDALTKGTGIPKKTIKGWKHPNLEALQAFNERVVAGMGLSDRVWNLTKQFKAELELAMEVGIGEGKSAADLSRDVRKFLREPNKLFRRVRDKSGALRLSKAARAYHPGRGVYRSSYKNALRMTATENNIAYRTSDHERWKQMPFILGIDIHTSNNHPQEDICDDLEGRYPADFKFTGWHPWCRCQATAALPSEAEFIKYGKAILNGSDQNFKFNGVQEEVPQKFKKWVTKNKTRIADATQMPYFLKDNPQYLEQAGYKIPNSQRDLFVKISKPAKADFMKATADTQATVTPANVDTHKPTPKEIGDRRHAARTQAQKDDILRRWSESRNHAHIIDRAKKTIAIAERYPSYNIVSLYKAVYNLDYAEIERLTAMQRKVLVNFAQVERRAIEAKIKIRAIETDPSRIKLGEDLADSVIRRLRANKKTALADARKWLTKLENSIPKENPSFAERLNTGETAGELATRLGKDCPATLKHLQAKVEELEKGIEKEFTAKERENFREGMKKVLENNDFCTNVDSQYLPNIVKEHLKNQFETGSSDGLMNTSVRSRFSQDAFGTPKGIKGEDYEKYGSIIPKDLTSRGTSYGDTVIRWKKDKVNCTFTIGDSLDFDSFVSPSLTTDPSIISVGKSGKSWMNKNLAKFRKAMEKTGGDLEQAKKLLGAPGYIEIQLHGKVDVDCIESAVLPSTDRVFRTAAQEKKFKEAINILLDKDIPVYQRESGTSKKLIKITKEYLEKNDI